MTRATRFLPLALLLFLFPMLSGCGGNVASSSQTNPPANLPAVVNVSIPEDNVTLGAGESHQFSATVTGTDNTAVTWRVSGCTGDVCGSITSAGYYTAPSHIPASSYVTVVATAQADPNKSDGTSVHLAPIAMQLDPMSGWMSPGGSLKFTATVQHDNGKGVTWSLTCSNAVCGTLSEVTPGSVLYTAPAEMPDPPTIVLAATSVTDPGIAVQAVITASSVESLVEGDYAFLFSGWEVDRSGGWYVAHSFTVAGHFHADGNGNILDGVEDINSMSGVSQSVPFTGTYMVGADRRGVLTIAGGGQTAIYHMVLEPSGTRAKFIRVDGTPGDSPVSGAGYLELQDKTTFSLSALTGDYAMGMSGEVPNRIAAVGRFTVGSGGNLTGGKMDMSRPYFSIGKLLLDYSANLVVTGSLAPPSTATGRGTVTLTVPAAQDQTPQNLNVVYYVVSDDKIFLMQTDPRGDGIAGSVLSGEARRQHGTFSAESFDGPSIFSMAGLNREGYGAYYERVAVGQLVGNGSGSVTGVIDDNGSGYVHPAVTNQAFYGAYTVASDGRATLQFQAANVDGAVAYLYGANQGFLMETSPGTDVLFGNITPQVQGPFDPGSITGTFLTATPPPTSEESQTESGLTRFDGESGAASSIDANENLYADPQQWLRHFELSGTYDVAPNGRGTLTFPSQSRTVVFWMISPTEMVGNAAMSSDGYYDTDWVALLEFTR